MLLFLQMQPFWFRPYGILLFTQCGGMCGGLVLLAAAGMTAMAIMTGCGAGDTASEKINDSAGETAKIWEKETEKERKTDSDSAGEEPPTENRNDSADQEQYTWQEYTVTLPKESDGILEIAVLDEGPSENPVTYFFQYDSTLSCIGWVPGIPFAGRNGGLNGFSGFGDITGESRVDLIETAYLQDNWWYDGSRILNLDIRWHDFLPSDSHVLYEDLPVYCEWDETSATAVIPAQEEVFFLGTDMEHWILVKGKDGSQGYMFVEDGKIAELNKPAEAVFSGLYFFD